MLPVNFSGQKTILIHFIMALLPLSMWTVQGNKSGSGICSWYGAPGEIPPGSYTSCGDFFDRTALTAAQLAGIDPKLPCHTVIRVTNTNNGATVDVLLNDRGGGIPGRVLDLTDTAFDMIANDTLGIIPCSYQVLQLGDPGGDDDDGGGGWGN